MLFIGDRNFKDTNRLKVKGKKKIYHESINCKRAVAVILVSDKTDFFFLFLFWAPYRIWSSWARDQIGATVVDLCRRCSNTRSLLTHCARPGIQPAFQYSRDATDPIVPQWKLPKQPLKQNTWISHHDSVG